MKSYFLLLFLFSQLFLCSKAKANEENMFFLFNEYCVQRAHDFGAIRASAEVIKWEKLSSEVLRSLQPMDSTTLDGWIASRNNKKFILILNTAVYKESTDKMCGVISYDVDPQILQTYIKKFLKVKTEEKEETALLIKHKNKITSEFDVPLRVDVTDIKEPGNTIVTLQAFIEEK